MNKAHNEPPPNSFYIWIQIFCGVYLAHTKNVIILPAHSESVGYKNSKLCRVTSNRYSWKHKVESVEFYDLLRIAFFSSY